jgi:RNA polymerase sigma-70 factor (ECF subfamily)
MHSLPRNQPDAEFTALLTRLQPRLRGFFLALTGNGPDADEVLQDTNQILWRKRETFEPGSNFQAWAFRTAALEARNFLRRRARTQGAELPSDELLDRVSSEADRLDGEFERRRAALTGCLNKLAQPDRALLVRRYFENQSLAVLAGERESTQNALAQKLFRLRVVVLRCIEKQMKRETSEGTP